MLHIVSFDIAKFTELFTNKTEYSLENKCQASFMCPIFLITKKLLDGIDHQGVFLNFGKDIAYGLPQVLLFVIPPGRSLRPPFTISAFTD